MHQKAVCNFKSSIAKNIRDQVFSRCNIYNFFVLWKIFWVDTSFCIQLLVTKDKKQPRCYLFIYKFVLSKVMRSFYNLNISDVDS